MRIVRTAIIGPAGEEGGTVASGAVGATRSIDPGTLPYWLLRGWKVDADDDGVADSAAASGTSALVNGTVAGQVPVWDTVDGRYEPQTPTDVTAADIPFTPTGTIAATNVQAAVAEVAAEAGSTGTALLAATRYNIARGAVASTAQTLTRDIGIRWDGPTTSLAAISVETTSAVASAALRFAIRSKNASNKPGTLVYQSSAAIDAAFAGAVTDTFAAPVTINTGDFIHIVSQGAAPTLRTVNNNDPLLPRLDATTTGGAGYFDSAGVTGAFPATFTASGLVSAVPALNVLTAP